MADSIEADVGAIKAVLSGLGQSYMAEDAD